MLLAEANHEDTSFAQYITQYVKDRGKARSKYDTTKYLLQKVLECHLEGVHGTDRARFRHKKIPSFMRLVERFRPLYRFCHTVGGTGVLFLMEKSFLERYAKHFATNERSWLTMRDQIPDYQPRATSKLCRRCRRRTARFRGFHSSSHKKCGAKCV